MYATRLDLTRPRSPRIVWTKLCSHIQILLYSCPCTETLSIGSQISLCWPLSSLVLLISLCRCCQGAAAIKAQLQQQVFVPLLTAFLSIIARIHSLIRRLLSRFEALSLKLVALLQEIANAYSKKHSEVILSFLLSSLIFILLPDCLIKRWLFIAHFKSYQVSYSSNLFPTRIGTGKERRFKEFDFTWYEFWGNICMLAFLKN